MEAENEEERPGVGKCRGSFTFVSNWARRWKGPAWRDEYPRENKDEACAFCSELIRSCENVLGEVLDSSRFAG